MKQKKIVNYKALARQILQAGNGCEWKTYIKEISAVNKEKQNGYCFEGKFLEVKDYLTECELSTDALYIICGDYDTKDGHEPSAVLATFDGKDFTPVSNIERGWDYALKLRSKAESLLVVKSNFDPEKFVSKFKPHEVVILKNYLLTSVNI